jgi:hypothetical protein
MVSKFIPGREHHFCQRVATDLGVIAVYERSASMDERALFYHRLYGEVYSCNWAEALSPGPWMQDLETALSVMSAFPP